jgi:hypothetical protein
MINKKLLKSFRKEDWKNPNYTTSLSGQGLIQI